MGIWPALGDRSGLPVKKLDMSAVDFWRVVPKALLTGIPAPGLHELSYSASSNPEANALEHNNELDSGCEMKAESVKSGGVRAKTLHALEKVFDLVMESVSPADELSSAQARLSPRHVRPRSTQGEVLPQLVVVAALVQDHAFAGWWGKRFCNLKIGSWSSIHYQLQQPSAPIHEGSKIGVEPALGASNDLRASAPHGACGVLVHPDVCGVPT